MVYSRFSLVTYFKHGSVYVNPNLSIHPTFPYPPWCPYICSLHLWLFFCFANKSPVPFSRLHIWEVLYDICFSVWLIHSLWHSLGPSICLEMAQFRSFLWLSNTPLHICTTCFIHLSTDGRLGCFHVLAVVKSAAVNIGVPVSFGVEFSPGICPGVGLLGHMVILFLVFWGTSILFSIMVSPTYIPTM